MSNPSTVHVVSNMGRITVLITLNGELTEPLDHAVMAALGRWLLNTPHHHPVKAEHIRVSRETTVASGAGKPTGWPTSGRREAMAGSDDVRGSGTVRARWVEPKEAKSE